MPIWKPGGGRAGGAARGFDTRLAGRHQRCGNCKHWGPDRAAVDMAAMVRNVARARGLLPHDGTARTRPRGLLEAGRVGYCAIGAAPGTLTVWDYICDDGHGNSRWTSGHAGRPDAGPTELNPEAKERLAPRAPMPDLNFGPDVLGVAPTKRPTVHLTLAGDSVTACGLPILAPDDAKGPNFTPNPDAVYGCTDCVVAAAEAVEQQPCAGLHAWDNAQDAEAVRFERGITLATRLYENAVVWTIRTGDGRPLALGGEPTVEAARAACEAAYFKIVADAQAPKPTCGCLAFPAGVAS